MWSIFAITATPAFSASAEMLSGPAALPLLIRLMGMLISSTVGGPTSIGRFVGAASMLGGFDGSVSSHDVFISGVVHSNLPSEWSGPWLGISQRLTAAYRRIDL
ncbi:unnamed protein product [Schistosoma mattheei]|uniref:Uncharacterized protein n=1 Tax=Schistosoma mattheei TaxID=31246 RepID=A0A183PAF5_9TREM|nr:unnamed protein product [Schistosoma mattheei]